MARLVMTREIGSEFHWSGVPEGPFVPWPSPGALYSSGREALLGLWQHLGRKDCLHVPDYFCGEVVEWWQKHGVTVRRYIDSPQLGAPRWDTLRVSPGDVVLAVNYFGVRDGSCWAEWKRINGDTLLVEDHSHDPLSPWALGSTADYAFASLRKTFPAPDGALLWSPANLSLPDEPGQGDLTGSALKLSAMILKKDYLAGGGERLKEIFREFQVQGEALIADASLKAISPWSRVLLSRGYPVAWREQRRKNVQDLLQLISGTPGIQALFNDWPDGTCPFAAVLLFPSRQIREQYRTRLINARIYPAVHWDVGGSASPAALELASRIMTLPVDQRYDENDVKFISSILLEIQ